MNHPLATEDDLSPAVIILITYACLAGIGAFITVVILLISWAPSISAYIAIIVPALISVVFGISASGVRAKKKWAWLLAFVSAALLVIAFPIGTILSYFVIASLWKCKSIYFTETHSKKSNKTMELTGHSAAVSGEAKYD